MNESSQSPLPCPADNAGLKKSRKNAGVKKAAIKCVFWTGAALVGAVAIPASVLFGIIYLIIKAMDFLTERIAKR